MKLTIEVPDMVLSQAGVPDEWDALKVSDVLESFVLTVQNELSDAVEAELEDQRERLLEKLEDAGVESLEELEARDLNVEGDPTRNGAFG